MTNEQRRTIALQAAAASWAGISALRDRDNSIINTARRFEEFILEIEPHEAAGSEPPEEDT